MSYNLYTLPLALVAGGILVLGAACERPDETVEQINPQSLEEKVSYGIGVDIGQDIDQQGLDLDRELLQRGIRDGLANELALSREELDRARKEFMAQRRAELQEEAARNREEGEKFLADNANQEGVEVLDSGLQYRVIEPGEGERPTIADNVKVHYRGYTIDGREFDNTYQDDQPAVFPVETVIPGWVEALPMMREGAKWELVVPAELAYGERGAGNKIGPGQTLIFEIELLQIH